MVAQPISEAQEISADEGLRLIDVRAREYLGMSGVEFERAYEAGELDMTDDRVFGLALLLPLGR